MRVRLLTVAAAALVLAGCSSGYQPAADAPPVLSAPTVEQPHPVVPELPVSIEIPALKVTDDIVPVGLDTTGGMEVPPVDRSGWFELGPRPGAVGPATVIGHVNYHRVNGALGRIGELKSGDQVIIGDHAGVTRVFVVYAVRSGLKKTDFATVTVPLVFTPTPGPELRLVTCSGAVSSGGQYSDNTVVSARLARP